ncbi:MAG: DUF2723 domain-containing protein [Phycisphaerae bacterium]
MNAQSKPETPKQAAARTENPAVEGGEPQSPTPDTAAWPRMDGVGVAAVLVTLIVLAVIMIPRLPPGVCFHDSGELQLASTVLGIVHAPGYPGYVSLGYLATLVPGVDPAYMVTLAYLLAGFAVICLLIMMQVRLGGEPLIACGIVFAFVAVPRVWENVITPEAYTPSLAFSAGAAYLLFRYTRLGRRRDLYWAAFLFGIALGNRPPVLFALPFFVLGWWIARKKWDRSWRESGRTFGILLGCAIVPIVYSLAYLYLRDTIATPYNYLENIYHESGQIPPLSNGWQAKVERVIYHTTGREFSYAMGNSWDEICDKGRWIYNEFFMYQPVKLVLVLVAVVGGAVIAFRRCAVASWVLTGLALASLIFIFAYGMYGQAADYMPLVWVAYILGGLSLSWVMARLRERPRRLISVALAAAAGTFVVWESRTWPGPGLGDDATDYLEAFDMAALPEDAVICTKWPEIPPLYYAKFVLTDRRDIQLIPAHDTHWLRLMRRYTDRPIFLTRSSKPVRHLKLTPCRFRVLEDPARPNRGAERRGTLLWRVDPDQRLDPTNPPR